MTAPPPARCDACGPAASGRSAGKGGIRRGEGPTCRGHRWLAGRAAIRTPMRLTTSDSPCTSLLSRVMCLPDSDDPRASAGAAIAGGSASTSSTWPRPDAPLGKREATMAVEAVAVDEDDVVGASGAAAASSMEGARATLPPPLPPEEDVRGTAKPAATMSAPLTPISPREALMMRRARGCCARSMAVHRVVRAASASRATCTRTGQERAMCTSAGLALQ